MAIDPVLFDKMYASIRHYHPHFPDKLPNRGTHVKITYRDGEVVFGTIKLVWMCMDEIAFEVIPDEEERVARALLGQELKPQLDFIPALEAHWEYA